MGYRYHVQLAEDIVPPQKRKKSVTLKLTVQCSLHVDLANLFDKQLKLNNNLSYFVSLVLNILLFLALFVFTHLLMTSMT